MQKLKGHLRHSARCRETLDGRNMNCPLVPGSGSIDDAERELLHDRLLPPIQCEGPMPPETRRRQRPDIDGELYDNLIDMITDASSAQDLFVSAAEFDFGQGYFMDKIAKHFALPRGHADPGGRRDSAH